MKIRILAVGKLKEPYAKIGADEYQRRLSKYASLEVVEVDNEKNKENASPAEEDIIKNKEGERLIEKIKSSDYNIALAIDGKKYSSEAFALRLKDITNSGISTITFIIGGSIGLSSDVYAKCNEKLSFSDFTFPHQLMRVVLLEQIYRAIKIQKHEPYHK